MRPRIYGSRNGGSIMIQQLILTGVPGREELAACPGVPSEERMQQGRVAVIECMQEIPCNPCEGACRFGAIIVGEDITGLPHLQESKCTGCGLCIAQCPGLAITVVNKNFSETEASIDFPFEYMPLPEAGDTVTAVNRAGEAVCEARVLRVMKARTQDGTTVLSIAIPKEYADDVRSIKRLKREGAKEGGSNE